MARTICPSQAGHPIPGYFSGSDCHSKSRKSSETKLTRLVEGTFGQYTDLFSTVEQNFNQT